MTKPHRSLFLIRAIMGLLLPFLAATGLKAAETRAAVAANFTLAAKEIGNAFEKETSHRVMFSFASTGQLYTQISHGAPFDLFLAADQDRADKTVANGLAVPDSRFTYALGRIALYSNTLGGSVSAETLLNTEVRKIAIANPATAPYGAAAVTALRRLGFHEQLQGKLVFGANIAQAFQFVHTRNAELGIIALSQIATSRDGARWIIPEDLYPPIAQDAVLLKRGADNEAAKAFMAFLKGAEALAIIRKYGYGSPEQNATPNHEAKP
ncbi:MAG: molybdate ABC transporter substrate-binding protein [Alphaproteobacteria bacterium]|nr:molybdate ABC transporter substrate-binding protein [Alphaproteobacteria bacterium]